MGNSAGELMEKFISAVLVRRPKAETRMLSAASFRVSRVGIAFVFWK
jgi:hypothetical protein